jgi:C4-dicarboxylate-specific signal transduction histidine kinase
MARSAIEANSAILASLAVIGASPDLLADDDHHRDDAMAHANRVALAGQLSASIAHEVAQPISGIVANAQVALRLLSAGRANIEEIRDALARVVRDGQRAGDVIGGLRALVKKAPPRADRLDLNAAIREVLSLAHGEIVKHRVALQTRLGAVPAIRGDRVQLQQVMLNLIMNAVEAMRAQDDARVLRITTRETASGGAEVVVEDSGPGLDPDDLVRVFDAFYTTKDDGLGMGLAICRSIVRAHGGKLWATGGKGRGAVFRFTVPGDAVPGHAVPGHALPSMSLSAR